MFSEDGEPLSPVLGGLAAGSRGSEDDLGAPGSSGLADDSDGSWARPSSEPGAGGGPSTGFAFCWGRH